MNYHAPAGRARPAKIPKGAERIAEAIAAAGKRYTFNDGFAYAYAPGNSCFRKSLGRIDALMLLDDEALAARIAAKFPRPGGGA